MEPARREPLRMGGILDSTFRLYCTQSRIPPGEKGAS
jgi:hypothetical protein